MNRIVTCHDCLQQYAAEDHMLGRELRCPACGGSLKPPAAEASQSPRLLAKPVRRQRRAPKVPWKPIATVIGLLCLVGLALLIILPAAAAFRSGYQRQAALNRGSDQWTEFHSEEHGFRIAMPDNFVVTSGKIPGRDTPAKDVVAKDTHGVRIQIWLASESGVQAWPAKLLEGMKVRPVKKPPASGLVVDTEFISKGEYYAWECIMTWGSSFCWVSVFGEDQAKIEEAAERVYASLKFSD